MTTWLLYAYKANDLDGEELRYSLRSITENLHMGEVEVMIVGDKPSWFCRGHFVEGNPFDEYGPRNTFHNIATASKVLADWGVADAIYLDDDYLLMYPQEDVIPVSQGPWEPYVKRMFRGRPKDNWWRVGAENTTALLRAAGISDPLSFEMHHPLPIRTDAAATVLAQVLRERVDAMPFWRTTYGNLVGFERPVRIAKDGLYYGGSPVKIGLPWVSAIPSQWEAHMRRRAEKAFRSPSRWEA